MIFSFQRFSRSALVRLWPIFPLPPQFSENRVGPSSIPVLLKAPLFQLVRFFSCDIQSAPPLYTPRPPLAVFGISGRHPGKHPCWFPQSIDLPTEPSRPFLFPFSFSPLSAFHVFPLSWPFPPVLNTTVSDDEGPFSPFCCCFSLQLAVTGT